MLKFSLITTGYIIKTRRFILWGLKLLSLDSLGAYLFIHLGLGIDQDSLPLRRISGLAVGIATGSTVECLRNREMISVAK
jgi:hypothetical protein